MKVATIEPSTSRKYCAWSVEDRDLVCAALMTCAKNRISNAEAPSPLRKKRQVDLDYIAELLTHKTSAQIRDYYYRSLKQIDKLIKERSYEFDTSNADDARAALIYYHKLQGTVYNDLNLTAKDKNQRRTANLYISERLVAALELFKSDPTKLISETEIEKLGETFDSTSEDGSISGKSRVSIKKPKNVPEHPSPRATKLHLNEEDFTFPPLMSRPHKKQRRLSNNFATLLEFEDERFPSCISPTDKSTKNPFFECNFEVNPESINENPNELVKLAGSAGFSRMLWSSDFEETDGDFLSESIQDKLNVWVTEHNDETVVQDMDDFLHSFFD